MDSDLSIIVLSESLDCLEPSQTRSLQDLVKQDVNEYLDKSLAKGLQFSVHEIEKLVLQSFDKHLNSTLISPWEEPTLGNDAEEVNFLDFFEYRVNTFLDVCELCGIDIQPEKVSTKKEIKEVKKPIECKKKLTLTKVQKANPKKVQYTEPKNCALRALNRKIRNIQQFIKEGTIYETTHKPRFRPKIKCFKKFTHDPNIKFPLMPKIEAEKIPVPLKEKPLAKFVYYGN